MWFKEICFFFLYIYPEWACRSTNWSSALKLVFLFVFCRLISISDEGWIPLSSALRGHPHLLLGTCLFCSAAPHLPLLQERRGGLQRKSSRRDSPLWFCCHVSYFVCVSEICWVKCFNNCSEWHSLSYLLYNRWLRTTAREGQSSANQLSANSGPIFLFVFV